MSFSSLAGNRLVSFTDAATGGFSLNAGQIHVSNNRCMTKDESLAKYYLVASNMNGISGNQLVQKSLWQAGPVFQSASYSESATKNNCPSGFTGTTVTLTASASQFSSTISQADANQQAINFVQANKQNHANNNGSCIGDTFNLSYTLTEEQNPFADADIFYDINGVGSAIFFAGSGTFSAKSGDTINVTAGSGSSQWGLNTTMRLRVTRNGSEITNQTITTQNNLSFSLGVVNSGDAYVIEVSTVSTPPLTVDCSAGSIEVFEDGELVSSGAGFGITKATRTIVIGSGTEIAPTFVLDFETLTTGQSGIFKGIILLQSGSVIYDSGYYDVGSSSVTLSPIVAVASSVNVVVEMYRQRNFFQ